MEPAIRAINLTKRFGNRVSVDCLSLSVQPGELYVLLGENGAGKTTTINLLTTLLQPTSGQFFINGCDGVKYAERAKGALAVVSQDVALYNELTALENLSFTADLYGVPSHLARQRISSWLTQLGLADRAHDRAGEFSGGMQRKLSIAMAMVHEPSVIFMDEPTVGLDAGSRRQIWEQLGDLRASGVTIFLTTHYLEEAELLADRVGIIHQGKLIVEGTIAELRAKFISHHTVVVSLGSATSEDRLKAALAQLQSSASGRVSYDSLRHELVFKRGKDICIGDYLGQVISLLDKQNIQFQALGPCEPSLEDVFLGMNVHGGMETGSMQPVSAGH